MQYSTVEHSTVQYSTVQYSSCTGIISICKIRRNSKYRVGSTGHGPLPLLLPLLTPLPLIMTTGVCPVPCALCLVPCDPCPVRSDPVRPDPDRSDLGPTILREPSLQTLVTDH
jgi:hypothetical protein